VVDGNSLFSLHNTESTIFNRMHTFEIVVMIIPGENLCRVTIYKDGSIAVHKQQTSFHFYKVTNLKVLVCREPSNIKNEFLFYFLVGFERDDSHFSVLKNEVKFQFFEVGVQKKLRVLTE
jgi:hypothetical protein